MKTLKLLCISLFAFTLIACGDNNDEEPAGAIVEEEVAEQESEQQDSGSGESDGNTNSGDVTGDSTDDSSDGSTDNSTSDSGSDNQSGTESDTDYDNSVSEMSDYSCDSSDHPKVGQMAVFQMYHHQVAGEVLIKDNCTLEITNFTYDGLGPDVLFYGGIDGDYRGSGAGFALSDNINGREYSNETVIIELTSPSYLDQMNGISVWCADVDVSFGDGLFQ